MATNRAVSVYPIQSTMIGTSAIRGIEYRLLTTGASSQPTSRTRPMTRPSTAPTTVPTTAPSTMAEQVESASAQKDGRVTTEGKAAAMPLGRGT